MENCPYLNKLVKHAGYPSEGDVIFVGSFTKKLGPLEEALGSLFAGDAFVISKEPLKARYNGYLRVNYSGKVLYNSMENTGILGTFLRRYGLIGPDKDWHRKIDNFDYSHAFRMKGGRLEELSGNLVEFQMNCSNNVLMDLDWLGITEFLKVGDYSPHGSIKITK